MNRKQSFEVTGVDGCKAGWFVVIALPNDTVSKGLWRTLTIDKIFTTRTFDEVVTKTRECKLICVDIPIGLSEGPQPRACDTEARKVLGRPRASSVFPAPIRPCLAAKDYKAASRISLERSGKKLNKQSFFLMGKIRQVDSLMTPALQKRIREIHPEISFWALNNKKPVQHSKRTLAGRKERMKLLATIFPDVQQILTDARKLPQVGPDDILDAIVAVWTAHQACIQKAKTLPKKPPIDSKGLRMEILYPLV